LRRASSIADGAEANVSELRCCVHTGTHVDAPNHFIDGAGGIETIDLDALYGPALVTDVGDAATIDESVLAGVDLEGVERVLFRSRNSALWDHEGFVSEFVSITPGAARRLVDRGVRLVGVDYLSVGDAETHRILLGARVVCLEGLDLRAVPPGRYELYCGPLKLAGSDGAPARVVLKG
jgi:arylformamidase